MTLSSCRVSRSRSISIIGTPVRKLLARLALSLRLPSKIVITVLAYQPGAENTKPALHELAARTLTEFALTGDID
jgi:hypothetical protein